MAGPRIFICNDGSSRQGAEYFHPSDGGGGAVTPWCGEGTGEYGAWVDVESLGLGTTPDGPAAVTPEQVAVQVAMVASVAFIGLKGLSIGLMR